MLTDVISPTPGGRERVPLSNNTFKMAMRGQGPFSSCSKIDTVLGESLFHGGNLICLILYTVSSIHRMTI